VNIVYQPDLKSGALPVPEIMATEVLKFEGGCYEPSVLEEKEAVADRGSHRSKERW